MWSTIEDTDVLTSWSLLSSRFKIQAGKCCFMRRSNRLDVPPMQPLLQLHVHPYITESTWWRGNTSPRTETNAARVRKMFFLGCCTSDFSDLPICFGAQPQYLIVKVRATRANFLQPSVSNTAVTFLTTNWPSWLGVGVGRIHLLHLCRGVTLHTTSVLDMTLNNLMLRFQ